MKFLILVTFISLSACNLLKCRVKTGGCVKSDIESSIRKSVVKRYSNYEIWELRASQVGYVESEYCQVDVRDRNLISIL